MATHNAKPDRNAELVKDRDAGLTYVAIAEKYGITVERARYIWKKAKMLERQKAKPQKVGTST